VRLDDLPERLTQADLLPVPEVIAESPGAPEPPTT
jgi:hypothetical protein